MQGTALTSAIAERGSMRSGSPDRDGRKFESLDRRVDRGGVWKNEERMYCKIKGVPSRERYRDDSAGTPVTAGRET